LTRVRYSTPVSKYEITSPANERIKRLVRLRQRGHRDAEGVFVVEGPRLIERALTIGLEPLEVFGDGSVHIDLEQIVLVEPSVLDKASYRRSSQGLIAVFRQFAWALADLTVSDPALVVVTEGLEKPGNLGAMLRTASAVGADAMITVDTTTDIFNPNVIRSSTGALFTLPVVSADLDSLRAWLEENSIALIATSPSTDRSLWDCDLTVPCALMVGAEDSGLSPRALATAHTTVAIPMRSLQVDSLNASVSLAVIAYETLRQRTSYSDSST
jgi:TrmH family RNA methyltransferase